MVEFYSTLNVDNTVDLEIFLEGQKNCLTLSLTPKELAMLSKAVNNCIEEMSGYNKLFGIVRVEEGK